MTKLSKKDILKHGLQEIFIVDIEQKEKRYDLNFYMLFNEVRSQGKLIVRLGGGRYLIKVLDEDLINEIDK